MSGEAPAAAARERISRDSAGLLIGAFAVAAFFIRAVPLFGPGGPAAAASGYDDGVYYAASAMVWRGVFAYSDFVFVHPPGILYALLPVSWIPNAAAGFAAARLLACGAGAVSTFLAGRIAQRTTGTFGGVVAAFLYATYRDAVVAEQSAYLEPFLNLFCLTAAALWLGDRRRPFLAGIACGAACAIKFWGGIWVIAAVVSAARGRSRADVTRFIAGAALAGAVLLAPFALPALDDFVTQTLRFQFDRPPDGTLDRSVRLREITDSGHRAATALALAGIAALFFRFRSITRSERFFGAAVVLTVLGFLASSSYWSHYNSHLAASQCVLAGIAAGLLARRWKPAVALVSVAVVAIDAASLRHLIRLPKAWSREMVGLQQAIPAIVPADASLFSFDPAWALTGGRLPPSGGSVPIVVDSYGAMLLEATQGGIRFPSTDAAFRNPSRPPSLISARLSASQYVLLGWRGNWQMSDADRAWFATRFECVNPEAGETCIWKQHRGVSGGPPTTDAHLAYFTDGWSGTEGVPPDTWRWMSGRSVTILPARDTPAVLTLHCEIPQEAAGTTIEVSMDDQLIERFASAEREVRKTWTIAPGKPGQRTLVISTSRTFNPKRAGISDDSRDLGLRVKDLTWRRVAGGASTSSSR